MQTMYCTMHCFYVVHVVHVVSAQTNILKQLRLVYNLQAIQQNPQPYKQGQTALKMQTRAICGMTEVINHIGNVQKGCRGNEDAEVQHKSVKPCWEPEGLPPTCLLGG